MSEARFKKLDASIDRLMNAYNSGNAQAFVAEFAPGELQLVDAQARIKNWRAKVGSYKSRTLNVAGSHSTEASANLAYQVTTDKGTFQLQVHFTDTRGTDMLGDADFRTANGMQVR